MNGIKRIVCCWCFVVTILAGSGAVAEEADRPAGGARKVRGFPFHATSAERFATP